MLCNVTALYKFVVFDNIGSFDKDVLIIHGDKDNIVPINYSVEAQKIYSHAELITYAGEGHGFSPAGGKKAREEVLSFMNEHLKK